MKNILYVASLDNYLMQLKSLVRKGRPHPVLAIRTTLYAHLRENLKTLGLHRRIKTPSLADLLNQGDEHEPLTQSDSNQTTDQGPMPSTDPLSFVSQPLTASNGHSGRCQNPLCHASMSGKQGKKFCSDRCRMDGYVLRRAKAMLDHVGIIEFHSLWIRYE